MYIGLPNIVFLNSYRYQTSDRQHTIHPYKMYIGLAIPLFKGCFIPVTPQLSSLYQPIRLVTQRLLVRNSLVPTLFVFSGLPTGYCLQINPRLQELLLQKLSASPTSYCLQIHLPLEEFLGTRTFSTRNENRLLFTPSSRSG